LDTFDPAHLTVICFAGRSGLRRQRPYTTFHSGERRWLTQPIAAD
jgi:hypothetical protein